MQVLVPCCAVTMVSTRTGGVVVIPVGKEQNVQFITTNVKFLTVTTRGTVSVESASVPQDILGSSVRKVNKQLNLRICLFEFKSTRNVKMIRSYQNLYNQTL